MKSLRTCAVRAAALSVAAFVLLSTFGGAQDAPATSAPGDTAGAVRDLQDQIHQLRDLVEQMRAENVQSRAEMQQLRQDLQSTRALLERPGTPAANPPAQAVAQSAPPAVAAPASSPDSSAQTPAPLEERVQKLEESTTLLGSKIDEQYQTKVETASKYRARLHGIVLMNAFRNVGVSNNLDLPDFAQPASPGASQTSFGASPRSAWRFLAPIWPVPERQPISNLILPEDLPPSATESTSGSSACKPPTCASTGGIPL